MLCRISTIVDIFKVILLLNLKGLSPSKNWNNKEFQKVKSPSTGAELRDPNIVFVKAICNIETNERLFTVYGYNYNFFNA